MSEEIYEKYASKIYKYIYSLCRDNDITEEILQDTFYSAMKNVGNFKGNSSIYTWLCSIAKNNWKNYLIKKNKIKIIPIDEDIVDNHILEDIESRDSVLHIYKIIHKLDPIIKEIVLLRIYSNLSFKEIGDLFGESEQWTRTNFYRGKLKIREELKNE